jgi:mannose-6-phosphate isomerase class I
MIIKLKPIALSKVWGGDNLAKKYHINLEKIGEIWGISAHKSYSNEILNEAYKGMTFRDLFETNKQLFGNYPKDEFPILCKIIDAASDLSVQVHPQDSYAVKHENSFGKDECWYILDAKENARIQIGHKANNKEALRNAINHKKIEEMLIYHQVNKEDYYYIPSGKVHAICKDTTLLEVSQSSDITYRLYDYNRLDQGKLRALHIDKSLDVITFPDTEIIKVNQDEFFDFKIIYTTNEIYHANKYGDYLYIIQGSGFVNREAIKYGDFIMISSLDSYQFSNRFKVALVKIR